jgi:3-oxoacyl-[acyl-carrier protein] reductase
VTSFDLGGRTAIVTGAGSGIGRASALRLAEAGARVVCADLVAATVESTATAIKEAGGESTAVTVDVSRRREVDELVASAGPLDIMCNIAGIMHDSLVMDTDEEDLDRVLAINLKGVFFGCQAAARAMVPRKQGSIINMASGAIDTPAPGIVCYAMAKAGVAQLTKTLAVEVGPSGVRVNAVAPGYIITNMTTRRYTDADGVIDESRRQAVVEPMRQRTPLGTVGEPDDIAYAVLYLASDLAKFMTGQILRPNGGVAMP